MSAPALDVVTLDDLEVKAAAAAEVTAEGTAEVRADEGIVTAITSVTGIVDEVDDIIVPGAYRKTLQKRKPKVCWHHSWEQPIGRVLHIEELMPGDTRLPTKQRNGQPWPKDAGALLTTMQFNLKSERGREAFEAVRFYSESGECEWSIGYQVPPGKATKDAKGVRHIKELDLYELSFVLFGAHTMTGTLALKSAVQVMMQVKAAGRTAASVRPFDIERAFLSVEIARPNSFVKDSAIDVPTLGRSQQVEDEDDDQPVLFPDLEDSLEDEVENPEDEEEDETETKRKLTAEQRHRKPTLPGSDTAWPIGDRTDLEAAIRSFGRAKPEERDKVKRWIIRRARELGAINLLPDKWNVKKSLDGGDAWSALLEAKADTKPGDRGGSIAELIEWYERGEGAIKHIRWPEKGAFGRCVRIASKHMTPEQAKGFCANRHHGATGKWPGDKDKKTAPSDMVETPSPDRMAAEEEPEHTGVMVAVFPSPEAAEQIAVRGGEKPEDLHVTLAYLGNITDDAGDGTTLDDAASRILAAAQIAAATHAPLTGKVGGIGKFPDTGDGVPVWAPVDVVGLNALRESVVTALTDAGLPVKTDHGFTPHMTLGYNLDMALIAPVDDVPVTFDSIVVALGGARTEVRLGQDTDVPASGAPVAGAPLNPPLNEGKATMYDPTLETGPHAGHKAAGVGPAKAYPHLSGSYEERQAALRGALTDALVPRSEDDEVRCGLTIDGTWPDRVVATVHDWRADDSQTYEVSYTFAPDGSIVLGEAQQVALSVSVVDDDGQEIDVPIGDLLPLSEMVESVSAAVKRARSAGTEAKDGQERKAGRVLSGANAQRLRAAVENLITVLAAAGIEINEEAATTGAIPLVDTETTAPSARATKALDGDDGDMVELDVAEIAATLAGIEAATREDA
jgi:HK97 family phage prohead protease